jgi:tetratricopeptide (TPR) repeat protein
MIVVKGTNLVAAGLLLSFVPCIATGGIEEATARGDAAWASRAEGHRGARAESGPIAKAVAAYEEALAEVPTHRQVRLKLLKALYFQGEHATEDREERLAIFEKGRNLAEEAITELTRDLGSGDGKKPRVEEVTAHLADDPGAAKVYFWGAVHWGLWGRYRGKIAAARQGVAGRIRDYASVVIALDDRYENAGGYRMLGRLHTEAPKLPFVTGWIDRSLAITQLERAAELGPDELLNRLYLAEAMLEFDRNRRGEAIERLRQLVEAEPKPGNLVEDLKAIEDAKALLAKAER